MTWIGDMEVMKLLLHGEEVIMPNEQQQSFQHAF